MIPVKICGITSAEDAELAVEFGASAIGMIFYPSSSRGVSMSTAKMISNTSQEKVKKIGVFVDEDVDKVNNTIEELHLDMVQLHGDETPEYCDKMTQPVIKVFRVGNGFDSNELKDYHVSAFLFDTYQKGKPGGTGDVFNWELILKINTDTPIILSGGLNVDNILKGIETVNPSAVDVNSGVESEPGVKDEEKVKNIFIKLENIKGNGELF